MVPAFALVYIEEDVDAMFLLDAALEHAGGAALDELIVDDVVGGRPTLHLPGLGLIHWENPVLQEFWYWEGPRRSCNHGEDGHGLSSPRVRDGDGRARDDGGRVEMSSPGPGSTVPGPG